MNEKRFDFYQQENSVCAELQELQRAKKNRTLINLKTYLGDDVYAKYDPVDGSIQLSRANSFDAEPFSSITIDIAQLDCLDKFRDSIRAVEAQS